MAKEILGDACAFIPGTNGGKNRYIKIGVAMRDMTNGSISFKIDATPLPGTGWGGWVNVFAKDSARTALPPYVKPPSAKGSFDDFEDDIPF